MLQKTLSFDFVFSALAVALTLTGCNDDVDGSGALAEPDHSAATATEGDGHAHDEGDVPDEYAGMTNPLESSDHLLTEAELLYGQHCAGCHGAEGLGDGEHSDGLLPVPEQPHR